MPQKPSRPPEPAPVAVSDELFAPVGRDVELCYQTFGDPDDEPLLLVMGLGGLMLWWDQRFCEQLARAGFHVVRYDNRDVGRSSRMTGRVGKAQLVRAFTGLVKVRAPYAVTDLAADAVGLLDHLGWESAHVVGVSMGGMIAQTLAITAPRRVRSLTSMSSTTGKRTVGWQHPSLLPTFLGRGVGRDAYIASSIKTWELIGSPGHPRSEDEIRLQAESTFDRGVSVSGSMRQIMAILTQPDRGPRLHSLHVPTLVIHGLADKMVHVSGGRATAAAVPDAELLLIEGMGHDLPEQLWDTIIAAIRRTADRARPRG